MRSVSRAAHATGSVLLLIVLTACHANSLRDLSPIVGTWIVKVPEAPFPMHMFAFHSDGTVQQSNPDAGDPNTSDSAAIGAWQADGDPASGQVKGKIVEFTADRATHQLVSRGEIPFTLQVSGDTFHGTCRASFFDASGRPIREPITATLDGQRVVP